MYYQSDTELTHYLPFVPLYGSILHHLCDKIGVHGQRNEDTNPQSLLISLVPLHWVDFERYHSIHYTGKRKGQ